MNAKWSLFSVVLILCLVLAGFALASSRIASNEEHVRLSAPELPREWQWKKHAISFDDMFRKR